jgi:Bacterial PH domain
MVYPGKRDWWLAGILAVVASVQLVTGGTLIGMALVGAVYPLLIPGGIVLAVGTLLTWILFGTNYEITESSLIIRTGPIRWTVPLDAIAEVVPTGGWYAGPEWSFSLAIRGLRVRYRKKNGRLTWPLRIAPQDRAAFLLELSERLPELEVKDDGSLRRPVKEIPDAAGAGDR